MSLKLIMGMALATVASTPVLAAKEDEGKRRFTTAMMLGSQQLRPTDIAREIARAKAEEEKKNKKSEPLTLKSLLRKAENATLNYIAERQATTRQDPSLDNRSSPTPNSTTYRNVTFPQGDISFADEVVSFRPGRPNPTEPHLGAQNALGVPDWLAGKNNCQIQSDCTFVSLGSGGELVVRFTDNVLTGSGDSEIDLWIMEVGPDVEDMTVDISTDGVNWQSVGAVGGGKSGVDIDAYGFGPETAFTYVRLTDDPNKGGRTGPTPGADIDAIGAISTRAGSATGCTCP